MPIDPTPSDSGAEARELIAALLGGGLAPAESMRLATMLAADAALRAEYQRQATMHAMLQWRHGRVRMADMGEINPIAIATLLEEAEREAQRQAAEEQEKRRAARIASEAEQQRMLEEIEELQRRSARRPQPIEIPLAAVYLGAAALAASILWLAATLFTSLTSRDVELVERGDPQPQAVAPQPISIATIGESVDAVLVLSPIGSNPKDAETEKETIVPTAAGSRLTAGRYELTSGVIGLQFDGGPNAILEAPLRIDLESAERVKLVRGRLVGSVPPGAIGFTVETPTATIVDLGTEFGVAVTAADATDVSVFKGEVEVVAAAAQEAVQNDSREVRERQRQRLKAGDSAHAAIEGLTDLAETSANLYWRIVPSREELAEKQAYEKWLKYSRSLSADPDVVAYYTFNNQQPTDRLLLNRVGDGKSFHGLIRGAQWGSGRWRFKQALRFPGSDPANRGGSDVRFELPESFEALTLAAWVNVDQLLEGENGLLMTETWDRPGQVHWQILQDGRLHIGIADLPPARHSQASASLGVWTHLAVVFDTRSSQTSFFIDGANVGVENAPLAEGVLLGLVNLGYWKPPEGDADKGAWRPLHGRVDELLVLGRVMSDKEVQALYEAGKPSDW
jgi:hypothetical protein